MQLENRDEGSMEGHTQEKALVGFSSLLARDMFLDPHGTTWDYNLKQKTQTLL